MELDFDQPRIRKDAKTSSEKKLERKRGILYLKKIFNHSSQTTKI